MRIRPLLLVAPLLVGVAACGSGESATPVNQGDKKPTPTTKPIDLSDATFVDHTAEAAVDVQGRDNMFVDQYIVVKKGTTVTFTNKGRNQHNILAADEKAFATVEADDFEPKESTTITFDEVGDVVYYCSLHGTKTKGMVGVVRILE